MIYVDNAATAPAVPGIIEAIQPWINNQMGYNANSLHAVGLSAYMAVEKARKQIADFIGADPEEIYFTSGATESINTVIFSSMYDILSTEIEHPAVMKTLKRLEHSVVVVDYIPTLKSGNIDLEWAIKSINDCLPHLVTMQMANNETGVILPYTAIRDTILDVKKKYSTSTLFMLDATQVLPYSKIDVHELGCDYLVASAHKWGSGIPGTGILYVKKGTEINPLLYGGEQEKGMRPGTVNVPGIVAAGYAAEYTMNHSVDNWYQIRMIRNYFETHLLHSGMDIKVNGCFEDRLPGHSSVTFKGIPGLKMQQWLSQNQIYVSTGSACSNGHASHVLKAMKLSDEDIDSTIRFSFGCNNTLADVDKIVEVLQRGIMMLT